MNKKVMVIDDDTIFVKIVRTRLEDKGYHVVTAFDGDEGLGKIPVAVPDLILLDVEMPRMNGYTFMVELNKMGGFQSTPVIVLTSHDEKQPIFQLRGVKDFLVKPVEFDLLLSKIHDCLFGSVQPRSEKVLVIDHKPAQREMINHFLKEKGFGELTLCATAQEGLSKAGQIQPDFIVINVLLEGMEEFKLCRDLKTIEGFKAKIILIAENVDAVDMQQAQKVGARGCVAKTQKYDLLIEAINRLT